MVYKLDLKDRKILNELDKNSRQSDSEIGKKTRISKQVVNYRIKQLIKEEIITDFVPHINIAKLGYFAHKVYIKFKSLTQAKEKEIHDYLKNQKSIVWFISCSGRWDLILGIASKNIEEFNSVLTGFMNKYSQFITERAISVFNKATLHHRKWLMNEKQDISWLLGGETEEIKIDEFDKKILNLLNENARMQIVELAEKCRISPSLAIQRIKKLQEKRIVEGFKLSLNREKLGIEYCKVFIYYQNKTSEKEQELIEYCSNLKEIFGISQSIGPWDLELEFEVESYNDFHKIMKKLKNKFSIIANFETVYIEEEHGFSYLPSL